MAHTESPVPGSDGTPGRRYSLNRRGATGKVAQRGAEANGLTMRPGSAAARNAAGGTRVLSVLAADPVPIFREGLHTIVEHTSGLRWAGYAANHHTAIQMSEQLRPDVVLVASGFDPRCNLVRLLTETHAMLVVIVLVGPEQRTSDYLTTALATGANGVLPRSSEPLRLTDGVRRACVERRYIDPTLVPLLPSAGSGGAAAAREAPFVHMPLSRREYQVLQLIAEGMENSTVAETLFLSVETVRTHVKSILRKLSAHDRTHAVTKAFRAGILVLTPGETEPPEHTRSS